MDSVFPVRASRTNPNMHDVAARAGVSLGTVSNVLNHPERVREATLQKVQRAVVELGFTRNTNARFLAAGDSQTIGLVVIDLGNTLFVDIARGAQQEATAEAFNLLIGNSDNDNALQDVHLNFFDGARVRGILLAPLVDPHSSIERVRRHGTPVVLLNYATGRDDCCAVLVDNERVGYLAARHMIELGRRHLAFVGGRDELQPVHDRRMGVRRAVAEADGSVRLVELPTTDLNTAGGRGAGIELARMPAAQRPDAVIAVTDLLGMAIVQEFAAADLAVPDDIAVMGCDHDSRAWGGAIPLTSVRLGGEEMGAAAFHLLTEEVHADGDHVHRVVVVQPSLVVRESSVGRTASSDGAAVANSASSASNVVMD